MTTNSPNPVDGDVQAHQMPVLTEQQREDALKVALRMAANNSIPSLNDHRYSQLFAEIALAALTAEPVYQFIVNNPDKDGYIEWADCNPDYFSNEPSDSRRILYDTPPAQLLRPVELPKKIERDDADDYWMHKSGRVSAVNAAYFNEAIKECAEALRQQGYEVKS
ncbi:hypothetical protein [Pantoea stewartii]|uniref:hypothetical protein n=1 Tax=Pantoea stewartii TaxID=66269 RepID=UPI00197F1C7A|nr:hypothetical protein [Pantoea stewartii]